MGAVSAYDLDGLGWLLFERLATDAVERELGIPASAWQGAADGRREALCDEGVPALGLHEPAAAHMAWVRRGRDGVGPRIEEATGDDDRPLVLVVNVTTRRCRTTRPTGSPIAAGSRPPSSARAS